VQSMALYEVQQHSDRQRTLTYSFIPSDFRQSTRSTDTVPLMGQLPCHSHVACPVHDVVAASDPFHYFQNM
jgi:hypothetical protein